MAKVVLKGVKKIYPLDKKDRKERKEEVLASDEKKPDLLITDKGVVAVQDFNLEIDDKEFVVFVGPSGCGKSTTLRMIAGLEEITEGTISIDGVVVNDLEPKDRDIAMVFQNYALYPHMTVYDNMGFALKMAKTPKAVIDEKVREAAEILGITEFLRRKPRALSGGQRQRVAIGRAIVRNPKVFLMDEPLSNLDAKLRNQMRAELINLRKRINTTFVYVTHDQVEAMTLGDRIVVMKDGVIQQVGTPLEVYAKPANTFVAGFIGVPQINFLDARLAKKENKYQVDVLGLSVILPDYMQEKLSGREDGDVTLAVRPEDIRLSEDGNGISGTLDVVELMGGESHLHIKAGDKDIVIRSFSSDKAIDKTTDKIVFTFAPEKIHLFDKETGNNLIW